MGQSWRHLCTKYQYLSFFYETRWVGYTSWSQPLACSLIRSSRHAWMEELTSTCTHSLPFGVWYFCRQYPECFAAGATAVWSHRQHQQWTWLCEPRLWFQTRCLFPEEKKFRLWESAETTQLQLLKVRSVLCGNSSDLWWLIFICCGIQLEKERISSLNSPGCHV